MSQVDDDDDDENNNDDDDDDDDVVFRECYRDLSVQELLVSNEEDE